ncbi:MAG: hypothetical protein HFJ10_08535 [Lachnospiraceae bacterium]|nr:hypothetical protein [Lachnospiraceae bacterium]
MKKLVIILGMHRSGTSMVSQICQSMGAYLGEQDELMGAAEDNRDGFFENKEIARINDEILRLCNQRWYTLETPEPDYRHPQIGKAMEEIKVNIQNLFNRSDIVAVKDPRISVLLPLWEKVINDLEAEVHYIWVCRNPLEVAESLRKRDGYSRKHSLMLWMHYNLRILKYLKEKEYLLIHYRDILENTQALDKFKQIFTHNFNREIVKRNYCHSNYTSQDILNLENQLLSDLYHQLLVNQNLETNVAEWERQYLKKIMKAEDRYVDYEVLEHVDYFKERALIIYGAGTYGKHAAQMLQQMGIFKFDFCDRDMHKHRTELMGGKVFSITELEKIENPLIVIAIKNEELRREIEQTLVYIKGVNFFSFFSLRSIWKYKVRDDDSLDFKADAFSSWYKELELRGNNVINTCQCDLLVYQNGKVGSSTVSKSLWNAGIENSHVHRFFFKNDVVGKLLLGEDKIEFIESSNYFSFQSQEYIKSIKEKVKGKKIITMVREPIAVDLSTVFQWIGSGTADVFFAKQLRQGKTFLQTVAELMAKIQNRLFDWFEEELKELCGIDVRDYPFDKEKGYTIISENGVEILLLKAEKLSNLTDIIGKFAGGGHPLVLTNENIGSSKEYAHLYREVKKRIQLPQAYVEYYYNNHPYMEHFYSKEEQKAFFNKWVGSTKKHRR